MPGYLTHAKVLIDTVEWLSDVEDKLQARISSKKPLSALEKTILDRARTARQYLRYKPGPADRTPPEVAANIKPTSKLEAVKKLIGVGHGISRFAFSGTLGVDFPAAAQVLVINQRWVSRTMHTGSPSISWIKAGSVPFIFSAIDQVVTLPGAAGAKPASSAKPGAGVGPLMAAVLGHCAGVAAHVVLHPAVAYLQTLEKEVTHAQIENALDALLAVAYFQRDDMNSGDSWTDYFLDDKEDWPPFVELYLQAFNQAYAGPDPTDTMCELPRVADLKAKFPVLDQLTKQFSDLEQRLARYHGYDKLFDSMPSLTGAVAKREFEKAKDLKSFLDDYPCRTPKLDHDFLENGWRNTVKWAIDEGYDKGPALFRWTWFTLLMFQGWYVPFKIVRGLDSSSTILETITFGAVKHPDSQAIADKNRDDWFGDGVTFDVVWDSFATSYDPGIAANTLTWFNYLASGVPILWDGLFGQGTAGFGEAVAGEKAYKILKIIYKVVTVGIGEIWPKSTESLPFKIADFVVGFGCDTFEGAKLNVRDQAKGREGDVLGRELWVLQLMCWTFQFCSCLLVLGAKSARKNDDGTRETGYKFWDFLLSLPLPLFGACVHVFWRKEFEKRILGVAGVYWPTTDTKPIDKFLKGVPDGKLQKLEDGDKVRVQLFPDASLQRPTRGVNRVHPEDENAKAYPTDGSGAQTYTGADYTLLQLFDRTKYLSGLLAMTAVKYYDDNADARRKTRQIFDDWNLDYRTEAEWLALMETVDGKPGLLKATEAWWNDLQSNRESDRVVLNRLQGFFGQTPTTGKAGGIKVLLQYEDGTPMKGAAFEAVFGDTRVPGETDETGLAEIDAPADHGDTYRLFITAYPEQQVVKDA